MTKKSLIVLSVCLAIGAGIAVYVWASGCCPDDDNLCHGGVISVGDCEFLFTVDHDRDGGGGSHEVHLFLKKTGGLSFDSFLLTVQSPWPFPVCVEYGRLLELEPNTTYYYYFVCNDCSPPSFDPGIGSNYTLNTGDCD